MPGVSPERKPSAARDIYAFGITSLLNDTASEMAYWVLPAFLASLGAGPTQLGLIEGVAESVASLAKLFSGYLADRVPRPDGVKAGLHHVTHPRHSPILCRTRQSGERRRSQCDADHNHRLDPAHRQAAAPQR